MQGGIKYRFLNAIRIYNGQGRDAWRPERPKKDE